MSFDYKKFKSEAQRNVDATTKSMGNFTLQQVHKYVAEVLKINLHDFTQLVGKYDRDSVDITGLSMGKQEALMYMQSKIKEKNIAGTPFTRFVQQNAEVIVAPTEYNVVSKANHADMIPMLYGLPRTEKPAVLLAHQAITAVLATSAPEYTKVEDSNKKERKEMSHPVTTDPKGLFYPSVCVAKSIEPIKKHYKGAVGILDVRARIIQEATSQGALMPISALSLWTHDYTVKNLKKEKKWKSTWTATDCVEDIVDEKTKAVYEKAKVDAVRIKQGQEIPTVPVTTLIEAYEFLSRCREVRGSDSSKISPLTHAYAYGELDGYYRGVNGSADIMQVMEILEADSVRYSPHSTYRSAWTILQYNTKIYKEGSAQKAYDDSNYGVFRLPKKEPENMLVIDCVSTSPPRKAKSGDWEFEPDVKASVEAIQFHLDEYNKAAIKVYAFPKLWEYFPRQVYPSLHAHSGVVWVLNKQGSAYTEDAHVTRMTKANLLKTYYPFMLKKVSVGDIVVWPAVCIKRLNQRKISTDFEIMYVTDESGTKEPEMSEEQIATLDSEQLAWTAKQKKRQETQASVMEYNKEKEKVMAEMAKEAEAQAQVDEEDQEDSQDPDKQNANEDDIINEGGDDLFTDYNEYGDEDQNNEGTPAPSEDEGEEDPEEDQD